LQQVKTVRSPLRDLSKSGITGLLDGYRMFRNQMGTGTVLVVFRETGIAAFIRQPVHELFDQSLGLVQLFPRQSIADTEERLPNKRFFTIPRKSASLTLL
jgi:hypothetical protein